MKRQERRRKQRVQLTRGMFAWYGATPTIILDITDGGARIEHFVRLDVGRRGRFRLEWRDKPVTVEATVVSCRVHRFSSGDDGMTVYQSGLYFSEYIDDAAGALRDLVATHVARSLAEQVANARGIGPVTERNMPVFRSGAMSMSGVDGKKRLLPESELVMHRGYVRCTLDGNRWEKKWTRKPEQPENGFTVLASEPSDHIDQLCETYRKASEEERAFIRTLAKVSVEHAGEMAEPR